jgi:hypothetical protein
MALVITPDVFVDLMRVCLSWEWEQGLAREKASHNREHRVYATQVGWTSVDKIVRILLGLGIVTKKQKSVFFKDRRLQHLVLHNSDIFSGYGDCVDVTLADSKRDFVFYVDPSETLNREKMLRNTRFYITDLGRMKAQRLVAKYSSSITKETYFKEIEKQEEEGPVTRAGKAKVYDRYRQRVEAETRGK